MLISFTIVGISAELREHTSRVDVSETSDQSAAFGWSSFFRNAVRFILIGLARIFNNQQGLDTCSVARDLPCKAGGLGDVSRSKRLLLVSFSCDFFGYRLGAQENSS